MNISLSLKHYSGILAGLLIAATALPAQTQESQLPGATNRMPVLAFPIGEELFYRIYWGYIPVGQTFIKTEWVDENGRKLLAIRYKTKTNRLFDAIYPVDDVAVSIVDPATFLPLRFTFNLARRKSRIDRTVIFDHARLKATMIEQETGKGSDIDIAADTRDLISFLYYSRSLEFHRYRTMKCSFIADSGMLDMKLKTYDYEKVDLDQFGKVSSLKMEPIAKLDKLLIEDGKVMSWIAKERCLAVKMTVKAPLASVSIELCSIRGPGNDFWSKAMQKNTDSKDCATQPETNTNVADSATMAPKP